MFLLVSGRHVGAHVGGHQHGVSIQISINLVKTFLRISSRRKIAVTWILARVFLYLPSFYFQILDLIYWTVLIFYFDLFWMAWHWKPAIEEVECFPRSLPIRLTIIFITLVISRFPSCMKWQHVSELGQQSVYSQISLSFNSVNNLAEPHAKDRKACWFKWCLLQQKFIRSTHHHICWTSMNASVINDFHFKEYLKIFSNWTQEARIVFREYIYFFVRGYSLDNT